MNSTDSKEKEELITFLRQENDLLKYVEDLLKMSINLRVLELADQQDIEEIVIRLQMPLGHKILFKKLIQNLRVIQYQAPVYQTFPYLPSIFENLKIDGTTDKIAFSPNKREINMIQRQNHSTFKDNIDSLYSLGI